VHQGVGWVPNHILPQTNHLAPTQKDIGVWLMTKNMTTTSRFAGVCKIYITIKDIPIPLIKYKLNNYNHVTIYSKYFYTLFKYYK
jgi:hypothetical protein